MVAQRCAQWTHFRKGGYLRGAAAPSPYISLQAGNYNSSYQAAKGLRHSDQKAQGEAVCLEGQGCRFSNLHVCQRGKKILCQRYQRGNCTSKSCKFTHACAFKVQGRPCGKNHGAHAHGTQTWQTTPAPPDAAVSQEEPVPLLVPRPLDAPPGVFDLPFPGRFFMDLFAGRNAPIFHACQQLQVDLLTPLDVELGWDILIDDNFERILHAAWNGFVGGAWSAPPCREHSRLKLKRPGPKPLRTPAHPYGLPSLNASEQLRLQTQETIHDRGRAILHAVHCKGGLVG